MGQDQVPVLRVFADHLEYALLYGPDHSFGFAVRHVLEFDEFDQHAVDGWEVHMLEGRNVLFSDVR